MAKEMMKKAELVFFPAPGVGHITSTIEVAKLITDLSDQFSVTVLVIKLPADKKPVPESTNPRVRFLQLRREESPKGPPPPPHLFLFQLIDEHRAHAREILAEIFNRSNSSNRLAGIVVDMFCTSMIDVAGEFGIPSYVFYTSGASFLGLAFRMQSLRDDFGEDVMKYQDSDAEIVVPTYVSPVPARVLPGAFFEKVGADIFIDQAKRYRKSTKGILINTFQDLESHAIKALCEDETIPPVYAIGPVLNLNDQKRESDHQVMIMKWLDRQPDSSVVFLCFGSLGTFTGEQVKEIACALENSGSRFLWSLRKPPSEDRVGYVTDDYENPEEVLPEGFLRRTAEVGKVIGWAPQAAVLAHQAVGGFVSHCGWNSTLESVWCGVPMAVWSLYAEQQVNSFLLVKELGLAVEIKMDYVADLGFETAEKNGHVDNIVSADVIEKGIKQLMDPENGIREKMKEMKEKSRLAIADGHDQEAGSSSSSLRYFLKNVINNITP